MALSKVLMEVGFDDRKGIQKLSRNLTKSFGKIGGMFGKIGSGMNKVLSVTSRLGNSIPLLGELLKKATASFDATVNNLGNLDQLNNFAEKLNDSAQNVQALRLALNKAGVDAGSVDSMINKFADWRTSGALFGLGLEGNTTGDMFNSILERVSGFKDDKNGQLLARNELERYFGNIQGLNALVDASFKGGLDLKGANQRLKALGFTNDTANKGSAAQTSVNVAEIEALTQRMALSANNSATTKGVRGSFQNAINSRFAVDTTPLQVSDVKAMNDAVSTFYDNQAKMNQVGQNVGLELVKRLQPLIEGLGELLEFVKDPNKTIMDVLKNLLSEAVSSLTSGITSGFSSIWSNITSGLGFGDDIKKSVDGVKNAIRDGQKPISKELGKNPPHIS